MWKLLRNRSGLVRRVFGNAWLPFVFGILCPHVIATPASRAGDPPLVKPLFYGNWADPTIVKIGEDYYYIANNDGYMPSALIWRSKDLRTWDPIGYALPDHAQGPASDLAVYADRLFLYGGSGYTPWAAYSDPPYLRWSAMVNLQPVSPHPIDAGHISDILGNRFLFTSGGRMLQISKDGLKAVSPSKIVYDGWPIPESLAVECMCLEGPKLFRFKEWFYMVSAEGGTVGPATSHMAVVARAKDLKGPWENSPHNPLIWTRSAEEEWWSKGHATLIEGPGNHWFAIYHGYEKANRSSGRCTLISPIEWTREGWPVPSGVWPEGWDGPIRINLPLCDDFGGGSLGLAWQAFGRFDPRRYALKSGALEVSAVDVEPGLSNPLTINPRHLSYEVVTALSIDGDVRAGFVLFYSPRAFIALALSGAGNLEKTIRTSAAGSTALDEKIPFFRKRIRFRIINKNQDVTFFYADTNGEWVKFERSGDISGFQHNVFGDFLSVRPGLFVSGKGTAKFEYFKYRGL